VLADVLPVSVVVVVCAGSAGAVGVVPLVVDGSVAAGLVVAGLVVVWSAWAVTGDAAEAIWVGTSGSALACVGLA